MSEEKDVLKPNKEIEYLLDCMNMYSQMSKAKQMFVLGLMHGITYNYDSIPHEKKTEVSC